MDEAGKARGRKFAAQIESAGWVLDAGQEDVTSSGGFWLYSYSIPQGSRLVAQLTPEGVSRYVLGRNAEACCRAQPS